MTTFDRMLITTVLALLIYALWLHKGELELLNDDVMTLRAQIGDLAKRPTTTVSRTKPKPKPRPPGTTTA